MIRQISVFVENQPGSMMNVTNVLTEAHVNIRAISTFDTPEFGIMRLVVDDPVRAKESLTSKGFVNRVSDVIGAELKDGRDMSVEDVKKLADGRTYTAKQAKNNGLIDEISLYPDMKDAMSKKLGTSTFYEMESDEGLLQSLFSKAESLVPKSEAQVLTETAKSVESGVPMYYAEQLR